MLYHVELSSQARRDLNDIYSYIDAEHSLPAAEWFVGLHDALASLSEMPFRSPVVQEVISARHLLYGKKPHIYRVIYLVDEERHLVRIVTVRHGARSRVQ